MATALPPRPSLAVPAVSLHPSVYKRRSEGSAAHGGGFPDVSWVCTKTTVTFPGLTGEAISLAACGICQGLKSKLLFTVLFFFQHILISVGKTLASLPKLSNI